MKRFVTKLVVFAALNGLVAVALMAATNHRFASFRQYETDSILLPTPRHTDFGLLIMGTSRARLFTKIKCNLDFLEEQLETKVFGIAIPFGGGIRPEMLYLKNFYRQGNSADTVLLFLDAFTLFAPQPNLEHRFVNYEPLRPDFLWDLIQNGYSRERIFTYIESKFSWRWFTQQPGVVECDPFVIPDPVIDPEKVRLRNESLYFEGLSEHYLGVFSQDLEEILRMVNVHGERMVIAFAPTLLGPQPGIDRVKAKLAELRRFYRFEVYDFTNAVSDLSLYSDYDHLNSEGVKAFFEKDLGPILKGG